MRQLTTIKPPRRFASSSILIGTLLFAVPAHVHGWEPNPRDLQSAIRSGDFSKYLGNTSAWLQRQVPAKPTEAAMATLLKDPAFALTLAEHQLITKTGADKLADFACAAPSNAVFLSWLMTNTQAMNLYLEATVPLSLAARETNSYSLSIAALEIWKDLFIADPDCRDGLYLKLAIATAIAPPGSINIGAGGAITPATPLARYRHYKSAHANKELFPSFDHLTVWEFTKIVSSGASDEDLTWAREMLNTWRPDLKANECVVNSTSEVWRRNSPIEFKGSFKNVLAGGGKCGPRSSWSVMICHAFGIPAIGVGQPGHACVAYKTAFPMNEPQPGSAWKVGYGRGWEVSKLEGLSGLEFLAGVQQREHAVMFSQVERLRWVASALTTPETVASIMEIARKIQESHMAVKTDVTASLKSEEAEKEVNSRARTTTAANNGSLNVGISPTHIDADQCVGMSRVNIYKCFAGGKQVNFEKNINDSWVEYSITAEEAGTYAITLKVAAANVDQVFYIKSGASDPVTIQIPWTKGLWDTTPAVELKLEKGEQKLRISAPFQRGIAIRHLDLISK